MSRTRSAARTLAGFTLLLPLLLTLWGGEAGAQNYRRVELGSSTDITFVPAFAVGPHRGLTESALDNDFYCRARDPDGRLLPYDADSPLVAGGCYTPSIDYYQRTFMPRGPEDVGTWHVECAFLTRIFHPGDPITECTAYGYCEWACSTHPSELQWGFSNWIIDVVPSLPDLTIHGPDEVYINEPINLSVTPYRAGLDYRWTLTRSDASGYFDVGSGGGITFTPTTEAFYTFDVSAYLTEHIRTGAPPKRVRVKNRRPRIALEGEAQIEVGDLLTVQTTVLIDDDGGDLTFSWIPMQVPVAALDHLDEVPLDGARLEVPTNDASAGTWSFIFFACDDEGACERDRFNVHVDGQPTAEIEGPDTISPTQFPLVLDASPSRDPDSDCSDGPLCHHWVAEEWGEMTPIYDVLSYTWYVDSVPSEHVDRYGTGGPVSAVFGVAGNNRELGLELDEILPGTYRFRVRVDDLEGNVDDAWHDVEVRHLDAPPVARVSAPRRYLVGLDGRVSETVIVDGSLSFDPDILYGADPIPADAGIEHFDWDVDAPAGCSGQTFGDEPTITPFSAGDVVPPECLGTWTVQLTVTDADGDTGSDETQIILGNCAGDVCIDFPTTATPARVGVGGVMDIDIYYHVDPTVYEAYPWGFYVRLDIVPSSGGDSVYTAYDPAAWASGPGSIPTFYWSGYANVGPFEGTRPPTGDYDIFLTVLDIASASTGLGDHQPLAIRSETPTLQVLASSDRYVPRGALEHRTDAFELTASLHGALGVDTWLWTVKNRDGAIATRRVVLSSNTTFSDSWDGRSGTTLQPPGEYTLEVTAFRDTEPLATALATFVIYELKLEPADGGEHARVLVNGDDDDGDAIPDLADSVVPGGDDDLVELRLWMEPRIQGKATMNTPARVALYGDDTKGSPCAPLCSFTVSSTALDQSVYVEGRTAGRTELEVGFTTTLGDVLPPTRLRVDVVQLRVIDSTGSPTPFVRVGMWDEAYDGLSLRNDPDPANHFIDRDQHRFSVELVDPGANEDVARREVVLARVGTLFEFPHGGVRDYTDPLTDIALTETSEDSGVFVSETQLLTSNDTPLLLGPPSEVPDDEEPVATSSGLVDDEAFGDRTHRVGRDGSDYLRGGVHVEIDNGAGAPSVSVEVPVCDRNPDERRVVRLTVSIWMEPFLDVGFVDSTGMHRGANDGVFQFEDDPLIGRPGVHDPHERSEPYFDLSTDPFAAQAAGGPAGPGHLPPIDGRSAVASADYVLREIAATKMAWAPSCVDFVVEHIDTGREPPPGIRFENNSYIIEDPPPHPFASLYTGTLSHNVVYIDVLGPNILHREVVGTMVIDTESLGIAGMPRFGGLGTDGMISHVALSSEAAPLEKVLAHELGHLLTNRYDNEFGGPTPPQWFFPYQVLPLSPGMPHPHDGARHQYRRFPVQAWVFARTDRGLSPTNQASPGNTLLTPYPPSP